MWGLPWNSTKYQKLATAGGPSSSTVSGGGGEGSSSNRSNSNSKTVGVVLELEGHDDSRNTVVVGRFRVTPGGSSGPFPAACHLLEHSLSSSSNNILSTQNSQHNRNAIVESCIVGGVLWKLQQFCRSYERKNKAIGKSMRAHLGILAVYLLSVVGLGIVIQSVTTTTTGTGSSSSSTAAPTTTTTIGGGGVLWWEGIGLLIVTVLYIAAVGFLGTTLKSSLEFRTKLDSLLQEISQELSSTGYTISQADKQQQQKSCCFGSGHHVSITVRRQCHQQQKQRQNNSLPPPATTSSSRNGLFPESSMMKDVKVSVESILYGMHTSLSASASPSSSSMVVTGAPPQPSFIIGGGQPAVLPVDDWIAGGLMLRLRLARYQASVRSRLLGLLILLPIGILSVLWVVMVSSSSAPNHNNDHDQNDTTTNHHQDNNYNTKANFWLVAIMMIGCILTLIYCYVRECLDGTSIHGASRIVVKQCSTIARDRHDYTIQYEVQPGDLLPKTTKGVIRFQPATTASGGGGGERDSPTRKEKGVAAAGAAQIAFV